MSEPKNQAGKKPRKKEAKKLIGVRLDEDIIARIDKVKQEHSTAYYECTRSDALRILILESLPHFEEMNRQAQAERESAASTTTKTEHKPARKPRC